MDHLFNFVFQSFWSNFSMMIKLIKVY